MTDAEILAEQITGALTEACLQWGEAINRAEAAKGMAQHEQHASIARMCGLEVARLSASIAKRLRPQ